MHCYIYSQGLYSVFSANASLAEPIIDILIGHVCAVKVSVLSLIMMNLNVQLKTYYEDEQDVIPPVKFNLCISSSGSDVIQVEPLVSCLFSSQLPGEITITVSCTYMSIYDLTKMLLIM